MSWQEWIENQLDPERKKSSYDLLCELAVSHYKLDKKSRKSDLKDRVHFFVFWWEKNRSKMSYYTSLKKFGDLLGVDHSTVIHYLRIRKKTILFEINTDCINDFLNS